MKISDGAFPDRIKKLRVYNFKQYTTTAVLRPDNHVSRVNLDPRELLVIAAIQELTETVRKMHPRMPLESGILFSCTM